MPPRTTLTNIIDKIGINPVINAAPDILAPIFEAAGRDKGPIPVKGTINGHEFIQTLVKYRGRWRLYINGPMLKAAGLAVGDQADISIEYDPAKRQASMPPDLAAALKADNHARNAFEALTPSRRKEILNYLNSLKSEAARDRNVRKVIGQLTGT